MQRPDDREVIEGKGCFLTLAKLLEGAFCGPKPNDLQAKGLDYTMKVYSIVYNHYQPILGHYFRNLYHVFRFIANSDFPEDQKRRYSSLARAQLSSGELLMLFYNCLSPSGEKFKPLVIEFGLLEHLDKCMLLDQSHLGFYPAKAYQ
jgi:hypothetical protein